MNPSVKMCSNCVNTNDNPTISFTPEGLCTICDAYKKHFNPTFTANKNTELRQRLMRLVHANKSKPVAMVGVSGGKDSTATLRDLRLFLHESALVAFTFDIGYYPPHIFERAADVATKMGVHHERISIQKYLRPVDRERYQLTANLYDLPENEETKRLFREWYTRGRAQYSIKSTATLPFVRTCQICRCAVIRAYYQEAAKRGATYVMLGMNEWTHLSLSQAGTSDCDMSGIRKLQPSPELPPVYVVHWPFIEQTTLKGTKSTLDAIGWKAPEGESLVACNWNSCLFAAAAEAKATRMLGFHPDTTRLAREVTAGFLTKEQARTALSQVHEYPLTVRQVLEQAGLV